MKVFRRVIGGGTYEFKEKRSLFRAVVAPAANADEAAAFWASVKEANRDATHNCPAWRTLDGTEFSSDDGEPGGTAGRPILGELLKADLYGAALVVTRWFGGVKLGPRGLIEAYGAAAAGALAACTAADACFARRVTFSTGYDGAKSAAHFLGALPLVEPPQITWEAQVGFSAAVACDDLPTVEAALAEHRFASLMTAPPAWGEECVITLTKER